ncbi:hypothetical protein [Primorskyibacter sedentarius]|uniref:Uncharacterized protein n=1 Tax=Primorskyibacter sedentarius TaxID=745311 RepID=A0A4V2UMV3_9RHOB|nr:hypothetical protein [Primorskyibacter sedentarius]TCS59571.1 hypothetical protein EDD52_1217 [Primorskyibacter sedentarius]
MEPFFPPHRAHQDKPASRRRRPARFASLKSRDAKDMTSLLISATACALTTGAFATLIMMSAPAYAGTAVTDGTESSPDKTAATEWLYPAHAVPGDDPAPVPFSGPRGLEMLPVCTCTLPLAQTN